MIEQQGKVVGVTGDLASIRLGGSQGCPACDAGRGCGAGLFGRLLKNRPVDLELNNRHDARPGQAVMVGIPEALFIRLVARLYLYPLLGGLAGAGIGHYLSLMMGLGPAGSDITALVCGILSGATVVIWNRTRFREFPGTAIVHLLRIVEIQKAENTK
jgi:sigma-E factor negative regulatory protein RseC